ncbi:MAG TPA: hybrid sensor histidine kinase/response regulator [Lacunisphaera sp.]|nr:hybrid sensor histidine kinase/response regulator [Lacunisphaera sp.]
MTSASSSRPCLLLVDDTPANIQVLVGLLRDDYELKVATRGVQALQICAQSPGLDLVLLDVMMPEMDGYEVCRRLRAVEATRDLPVIFLTAKAELDDMVHGFEIGANDYVAKPFRPAELLARVRTHLLVRAQQREIARKGTELAEMLQIVCHDVANHFSIVNMSLELAAANPAGGLEKYVSRMTAAARNGVALTNLVREMRRLEDKSVELQPVSLAAAVQEALVLADGRLQDKKLQVVVEVADVRVLAEPTALINSVLGNLFSNAAKFSHPGGMIEIRSRSEGGAVTVSVRDHGIGMPATIVAELFDVSKSHSRRGTAGEKGTGFGMPLMRKFVLQFGGSVEVASRDIAEHPADHGTEFRIRLKLAP